MSEERFVSKIQKMHRVSINPVIMKKLDLKEKDLIEMVIEKDGIKLRKMEWKE
jgi:anaerobic selenocysteine-containing dehydrogenase